MPAAFDLESFLPYLLNQAAEATSRSFQTLYQARYGLSRTGWRVIATLGKFGAMTARDICALSHIEKTKVSRAVVGLQTEGLVDRHTSPDDKRAEILSLTAKGRALFAELGQTAICYDQELRQTLGQTLGTDVSAQLDTVLRHLTATASDRRADDATSDIQVTKADNGLG